MSVEIVRRLVLVVGFSVVAVPAFAACRPGPSYNACIAQEQRQQQQAQQQRQQQQQQMQQQQQQALQQRQRQQQQLQQQQVPQNGAQPNFGRPPGFPNQPQRGFGQQQGPQNQPPRNFGQQQGPQGQPPRTFGQQQGPQNQSQRNFGQRQEPQNQPPRTFGQQQGPQNPIQQGRGQGQGRGVQNAGLNSAGPARGPVRVTQGTTIAEHPDRRGLTITHREANGAQLVVNRRTLPDGRKQTTAYRQIVDPKTRAQTRIYSDGRKITTGPDFVRRSTPGRMQVTNYKTGLREMALANGRPVFHERFGTMRGRDGATHQTVVRTVYARVHRGRPAVLAAPVEEVYAVVPYNGAVLYPYYPFAFEAAFYTPFLAPFAAPVPVDAFCDTCLPPAVAFSEPAPAYSDPNDLLGDMQIATGFDDGMAAPPQDQPGPDTDVSQLQSEMTALQDEVQSAESENADLRSQLAGQQSEIDSLQQSSEVSPPADTVAKIPVPIPEDVRMQVRKQVKTDVSLHREGQPLSLADIIGSPEAQNYVFQVSDIVDATDLNTGEECSLSTGDLAKFNKVPGEDDAAAEMKIVTAKAGSCKPGSVVAIGMSDLQDMLNAFSQRLENNMRVVSINLKEKNYSFAPPQ